MVECLYASLFPKLDKFIVLLQVVLLSKLGRKGKVRASLFTKILASGILWTSRGASGVLYASSGLPGTRI